LLLDRKRINKWGKWVALFLAIIFAVGFIFMGVGYGGDGGFNISSIFTGNDKVPENPQTPEDKVAAYQATLATNPNDATALLGLATIYEQAGDLSTAAAYLEKLIAADSSQKDVYLRLAKLYMSENFAQYAAAVTVLNKATAVDPSNPDVYLRLGMAQNNLGNTEAAVLAYNRYLQLAPTGDMATVVKEQVEKLSKKPTTTTTTSSTTTTASSSTTTTASSGTTTTTAAPTTTSGS